MPFDGSEVNPIVAHLLRTKAYLAEHGWCSHGPMDESGAVCVGRAIALTRGTEIPGSSKPFEFFLRAASHWDIGKWNDAPGRTLEEVNAALDRAVELSISSM